jgi:prevent-host-death family protein
MFTQTVDISEVESRFSELLRLVNKGTEIILTKKNVPVARLVPVEPVKKQRIPGLHAGASWTSGDFDDPLPEQFWVSEV